MAIICGFLISGVIVAVNFPVIPIVRRDFRRYPPSPALPRRARGPDAPPAGGGWEGGRLSLENLQQEKYQAIIADYNREKDRATVEATFAQLVELAGGLDAEQRRAAAEGLSDEELALFDLLFKDNFGKADRERLKQASRALLASLRELLQPMQEWTQKAATQAEVKVFILDRLYATLPRPPFTDIETEAIAARVYDHVWQRSASGYGLLAA